MNFLKSYEEEIEKAKLFFSETIAELNKTILQLNERYQPMSWIKSNPGYAISAIVLLVIVAMYPLMSVWLLACVGTGYPGYKIIQSILADKEDLAQKNKKQNEISEFIHAFATEQKIIQIPIRSNSRINMRNVIIRGEMEDGLAVIDPLTGIQSKYLWDNIDLDSFYLNYIKPNANKSASG
jgi:hypothetical protein